VYGSSCPNLRLDDVVVHSGRQRPMVYADIVNVDAPSACTADAVPRAYVVALARDRLPAGPFAIQLGADDPPAGAPEERTLVDADLSQPGAVAGPGDIRFDPSLPGPSFLQSGDYVEPGFPSPYRIWAHCGVEWLGDLNGVAWRTDVPPGAGQWPAEWTREPGTDWIHVSILLNMDPEGEHTIEATANGRTVVYRATTERPPGCF
jgi:hypothetical protein